MKKFMRKRVALALGVAALVVAIAGAAFAYFTSSGSGTGSATVGSSSSFTIASQTATGGPLFPDPHGTGSAVGNGANVESIGYAVTNPSNGSQNLTQVVVSIANANGTAWSAQANTAKPACNASDFSVDGSAVGTPATDTSLAGNLTSKQTTANGTVKLELIDNGTNQDNCQGVTVPLYFAAS